MKDQFTYETTTSRLKSILDAKNQTKQYSYFNDNQLKQVSYLNAVVPTATVSFTYDPYFPYRTSMVDGTGTTQYQYVPVGQLGALQLKQSDGAFNNDVVSYQYDALGRVSSRTIDTTTDSYTYDNLGRVTQHNTPIGNYLRTYLGETEQRTGEHKQVASGVGLGTDWQYDTNTNDRRLKAITHTTGKNFYYTRNIEDIITNVHETSNRTGDTTQDAAYTYDNNDRLTKAISNYTPPLYNYTTYTWNYTYDVANNITNVLMNVGSVNQNTSYTVNNLNQIDNTYPSATYDANGNTTKDTYGRLHEWDAENRLTKTTLHGNTTIQYDGLGRFVKITTPQNGELRFLWCGDELCQSRNSTDTVQKHFYDEGFHSQSGSSASVYYLKDHLGSVHQGVDTGNGTYFYLTFCYDAYGWFCAASQATPYMNYFQYAGMFYLPEAELYLTRHRAYDPRKGRWLSRDPIEEAGGLNLYGYVEGNPVNFRDPFGLYKTLGCSPKQKKKVKNYCEVATKKANKFGIGDKFQSTLDDTTISCEPPPIYQTSCGGRHPNNPIIYLNFKEIPNTYPCNLSATTLHEVSHLPPLSYDEADAYKLQYNAFPSDPRFTPELFNDAYRHTNDAEKQKYGNYYKNNFQ